MLLLDFTFGALCGLVFYLIVLGMANPALVMYELRLPIRIVRRYRRRLKRRAGRPSGDRG